MGDQLGPAKPNSIFKDFVENVVPFLFYIFFPGFMFGFYFSIPLGFVAGFIGFFMFQLHCDLLDIKKRLDTVIQSLPDKRR